MVFSVPDSISKNAAAVVRYNETTVEILNQHSMSINKKGAITIYNKSADDLANLFLGYDKNTKINAVNLEYFDMLGKSIKKVKKSDFKDHVAVDGFSLYVDDRLIYYEYIPVSYPYTIVYSYETTTSNTAFIPDWYPIRGYGLGVESSTYTFKYPEGFKVQKSERNFEQWNVKKEESSGLLKYSISQFKPLEHEEISPSLKTIVPSLELAINKFHLSGVDGEAENWEDFGKWMYEKLLSSRNNLSETTRYSIKQLVKDISDPKEKARIIYEYVQNKTRYINVAIGIGGWMPMTTDEVDRLAYGDCKALTFYTKSLLEEVGIPAYYSTVFADDDKTNIEKEVVSVQGNHAFLVLPMEKDTIYMECTSQKLPFGLNGFSTQDRDVFTITPSGGKIIHTNVLTPEDNLQKTTAQIQLDSRGGIQSKVDITTHGNQLADRLIYDGLQPSDLDKEYKNYFDNINNITFQNIKNNNNKKEKTFEESFEFYASNYAVINADGTIIFSPNALNKIDYIPQKVKDRTLPFQIDYSFNDVDEIIITLPEGYVVNGLPEAVSLENDFGKYSFSIESVDESTLLYKRNITVKSGLFPKERFEEYRRYRKDIKKYDDIKLLLVKK